MFASVRMDPTAIGFLQIFRDRFISHTLRSSAMPIILAAFALIAVLAIAAAVLTNSFVGKVVAALNGPLGYGLGIGLAVVLILYGRSVLKEKSNTTPPASTDDGESDDRGASQ